MVVAGLGEDISKLAGGVHLNQAHLAVLDSFVREVLANVDISRPPITWLPHSMHAMLSSYTCVSGAGMNPMFSSRLRRYSTSIAISDAK